MINDDIYNIDIINASFCVIIEKMSRFNKIKSQKSIVYKLTKDI